MAKRIAIDINDVLRDFTYQIYKIYTKTFDPSKFYSITDYTVNEATLPHDDINEITTNNLQEFLNMTKEEYEQFLYVDYPLEIYGLAEVVDKHYLPYRFVDWVQRDMKDFEEVPEIMLVSPMESGLTIQSTLHFLSKMPSRVREIYFPTDSSTVWDRCDILITANPLFLNNVPEGKVCVKINKSYNKDIDTGYSFDSMMDVIEDKDFIFSNLIEDE